MRFSVLGGGSKGNSLYVCNAKEAVLVDSGFSVKETIRRLSLIAPQENALETIKALFVTHEHSDHINGIGVLSRRLKIPVYMTGGTYQALPERIGALHRVNIIRPGQKIEAAGMSIESFSTSHDAADPVGYSITGKKGSIGYATDLGVVTNLVRARLMNCDYLVIEANHDFKMLMTGSYPPELKTRVNSSRGHLSNDSCAGFVKSLLNEKIKGIVLSHLSEENNKPELALAAVSQVIKEYIKTCRVQNHVHLEVAHQKVPTPMMIM
jgi:phosphoribosyl 1,2-cyclic phosphodiesterase